MTIFLTSISIISALFCLGAFNKHKRYKETVALFSLPKDTILKMDRNTYILLRSCRLDDKYIFEPNTVLGLFNRSTILGLSFEIIPDTEKIIPPLAPPPPPPPKPDQAKTI